jgi:hypothetical protein
VLILKDLADEYFLILENLELFAEKNLNFDD